MARLFATRCHRQRGARNSSDPLLGRPRHGWGHGSQPIDEECHRLPSASEGVPCPIPLAGDPSLRARGHLRRRADRVAQQRDAIPPGWSPRCHGLAWRLAPVPGPGSGRKTVADQHGPGAPPASHFMADRSLSPRNQARACA